MILYLGFIVLAFSPGFIFGQSIQRQCISSYGASGTAGQVTFLQTAGQSFGTTTQGESSTGTTPGFQQSITLKVLTVKSPIDKTLNLDVYPNPAASSINIESREPMDHLSLTVINSLGQVRLTRYLNNTGAFKLDCSHWENGIYFINATNDQKISETIKIVIAK